VFSAKQKVVADLVNLGANIKIPIVAINITNVKRDPSRVFNKLQEMQFPRGIANPTLSSPATSWQSDSFKMPVPVKLSVTVSIISKFMRDLTQIYQNFLVNCNPYFYVSWTIPTGFLTTVTEIRNKVTWSEDIQIITPIPAVANTTSHYEAETSFEIEGWLFGPVPTSTVENIYFIESQFIPVVDINSSLWATTSATIFENLSSSLYLTADNVWITADQTTYTADLSSLVPPLTANMIQEIELY